MPPAYFTKLSAVKSIFYDVIDKTNPKTKGGEESMATKKAPAKKAKKTTKKK